MRAIVGWKLSIRRRAKERLAVLESPGSRSVERCFQNEEAMMNCVICKVGKTKPGLVTVTLIRGETTVLIKETPAEVCGNCGEYYLEGSVASKVHRQAEETVQRTAEVEILRFAA